MNPSTVQSIFNQQRALELLRKGSGISDADFRDGQSEAIQELAEGNRRLLVVQKTGWGKSFVYFIATKLLRENGGGPALLISPLLALMRNQIAAAERMGVRAVTINSDNQESWAEIEAKVRRNEVDILLVSPERLANQQFLQNVLSIVGAQVSMLVIDEAHCISDWGHDFRPHYRLIQRLSKNLPEGHRLLATTATANNRVMDDLCDVLGPNLKVIRGELGRPSLYLQTMRFDHLTERMAWLADHIPSLPGCGIIYCLTIRDALRVCDWLCARGIRAEAYSGRSENRPELEQQLLNNELKVLVATTALGMGFDKPDLAFVIHFQTPGSVVAYYQQVGRAGRALDAAYGILLSGEEENDINNFFIESAFPSMDEVNQILAALNEAPDGLSLPQLCNCLNIRNNRIEKALQLLSLESPAPITKEKTKWVLTSSDVSDNFWQRAQRLTQLRRAEWQQMQDYVALADGHMEYLIRALDGDPEGYSRPKLAPIPNTLIEATLIEAAEYVKRSSFPIEPRRQWRVSQALPTYGFRGNIPESHRVEYGRVLSVWGDPGWGERVRAGKSAGLFSNDLVEAMAALVLDWRPEPRPTWLTYVPSPRHPDLVPDFAKRLAQRLSIPCVATLRIQKKYPPQKTMQNSAQQLQNLDGAFEVISDSILPGPCMLVDDIVDSRWTFTVCGHLLKDAGIAEIFPLALASTAPS
jgi:ATP-dependent DNA helicase RecQ